MTECYLQNGNHEAACRCDNCGEVHRFGDLDMIADIQERLDPGGVVPAGQCPECGALAYLETPTEWSEAARLLRLQRIEKSTSYALLVFDDTKDAELLVARLRVVLAEGEAEIAPPPVDEPEYKGGVPHA